MAIPVMGSLLGLPATAGTAADSLAQAPSGPTLDMYLPLVILFVLALVFALFSVALGPLVGPSRRNTAKTAAYECGIDPSPQPSGGGGRMPVAYYITAMLFILFDIEMVFLYPFAVSASALGLFGLAEIVLFIATVAFAYAYVWRRGGLDWN